MAPTFLPGKMNTPAVSVIIPTRNRPETLRRALASVAWQTLSDLEVVIGCDDADPTAARQAFAESKLPGEVIHVGGKGPATARNTAAAETRFSFLAFLDDDDVWRPRHLEIGLEALGRRGKDAVFYGAAADSKTGAHLSSHRPPAQGRAAGALLLDNVVTTSAVIMPKNLFISLGGFDLSFEPAEDYRLWLKAATVADFIWDRSVHVDVSLEGTGLSADKPRSFLATARGIEAYLAESGVPADALPGLPRRLADLYHAAATALICSGNLREGRKMLLRSVVISPGRLGAVIRWFG